MNLFEKLFLIVAGKWALERMVEANEEQELKRRTRECIEESRLLVKRSKEFRRKQKLLKYPDDKLEPEVIEWLKTSKNVE